jgi:osmotically-inducible protein OsmY
MDIEHEYLVGRLEEALAADARVNALDIHVMVRGGRVHLTGQVTTEERRAAVARVVAELQPELEVHNEVSVLELNASVQREGLDA